MEIYIVVPRPAYPPCSLRVGGLKRSHILSIFGLIKIMWIYSWGRPLWLHFYLWKGHVWEGDSFFTYFWAKVLLFLAGKKHLYIRGHIFHGYSYLWVVECWVDYYIFYICVFFLYMLHMIVIFRDGTFPPCAFLHKRLFLLFSKSTFIWESYDGRLSSRERRQVGWYIFPTFGMWRVVFGLAPQFNVFTPFNSLGWLAICIAYCSCRVG